MASSTLMPLFFNLWSKSLMLDSSMIHLPQPLQVRAPDLEQVSRVFRSLGSENWSIHIGLDRLFGSGSQVFETVGGLLGDGGLGKHDDRKQVAG